MCIRDSCHTAGHYGEEYDDWNSDVFSRGGTAAAMAWNEQTVEKHSTLDEQPLGRLDHPACVEVMMMMMMMESPVGTTYELWPSSVDCVSSCGM